MELKDICVGRKYTDRSGTEKTQWEIIGKMFVKDDGKTSIVIKSIPVGWDGGAMVFDRKPKDAPQVQQVQQQQTDGVPF